MDASRTLKNRRGIAVVYLALLLFVLVGFAALVIDLGYFYVVKGQLQNAADAAALAGVTALKGTISSNPFANETSARNRAQSFAGKNTAETSSVSLDLNLANSTNGDIVIGCWNNATLAMNTGCGRPNSVLVNARRSSDAGVGPTPVSTFFGNVLGVDTVNIGARAVAQRPPKPTVPLAICSPTGTGACDAPGTYTYYFLESSSGTYAHPSEFTTGWTEFSLSSATDLGPNSDIAKILEGALPIPDDVCEENIKTNTGLGDAIDLLHEIYDAKKNAAGRWRVILPIFRYCPAILPSTESSNYLTSYAEGDITSVVSKGAAGGRSITVDILSCSTCSTATFLSNAPKLVK